MKQKRAALEPVLAALILFIPIYLIAPSIVYSNNTHDVTIKFGNIIIYASVLTFVSAAIFAPIFFLTRSAFVAAGIGIAIAAKLLFLPSFVPLLDGDEVFSTLWSSEGIWSLVTLAALALAGCAVAWRLTTGATALIAATLVLLGLQPLLSPQSWALDWPSFVRANGPAPGSPEAEVSKFSKDGDTMIVLMDTVQSDVFAEVLEQHPAYQEALTGFTYFWNAVGRSPTTLMSMLPIYSGRPYDGGRISARYEGLRRDSIFSDFEKRGYDTMLLGISIMGCPAATCGDAKKLINIPPIESDFSDYLELVELGLMRTLPTFLQERWYNRGSGRLRVFLPHIPVNHAGQSIAAMESLAATLKSADGPQRLKVLHLLGAHPPITLDKRCRAVAVKGKPRTAYKELVECNVAAFVELVQALKSAGVYDQMTLVLMADHGETTSAPSRQLGPFLGVVPALSGRRGRFGPLFAIKLPRSGHPLRLSAVPAQNSDLRATLCGEVIECGQNVPGDDVFRLEDDATRERCFIDFMLWQTDHRRLDSMPPQAYQQFCITGLLVDADYDPSGLPPRSAF